METFIVVKPIQLGERGIHEVTLHNVVIIVLSVIVLILNIEIYYGIFYYVSIILYVTLLSKCPSDPVL